MSKILIRGVGFVGCMLTGLFFSGCGKQTKLPEKMDYRELKTGAKDALKEGRRERAIAILTRIVSEHPESVEAGMYRLALGDLFFDRARERHDEGDFAVAYQCYRKFYKLNPSDPRAEYASYRAVLSRFCQM